MAGEQIRISGIDDLKLKLAAIPRAMRVKVLRNSLSAGARIIRDYAKRNTPVLRSAETPYRTKGTLKRAIRVRTSKRDRKTGDVGVFVGVKPLPKGQRGAKNPQDPYYWRWQEFGWTPATGKRGSSGRLYRRLSVKRGDARKIPGKRFLRDAAAKLTDALPPFVRGVKEWLTKAEGSGKIIP